MPAAHEGEDAIRVGTEPQWLKLGQANSASEVTPAGKTGSIQLWPWTPEVLLLRRGLWPGPRVGIERRSRFRIWRLRRGLICLIPLRIEADLRSGRREILRSPVYRMLVASQQTPWTGHGRDFERLREYQPGDNYSEIAWKSTARRGAPVTRLFQWEQKQEVYFVVDQSRASALALDSMSMPRVMSQTSATATDAGSRCGDAPWSARPSRLNLATSLGWSPMRMSRSPGYALEAVKHIFISFVNAFNIEPLPTTCGLRSTL